MVKYSRAGILFGILANFVLAIFILDSQIAHSNSSVIPIIPNLGLIAILLGGAALWGKQKDTLGIVGIGLGLVAIICSIILIIFVSRSLIATS